MTNAARLSVRFSFALCDNVSVHLACIHFACRGLLPTSSACLLQRDRRSTAELLPDVTSRPRGVVARDDVGARSVDAGRRGRVGGRRARVAGRRRHLGDADERACGRDAVRQAARRARDAVQPATGARRRVSRAAVRVTSRRTAALHAADRNDRALERRPGCAAIPTRLSTAAAAAADTAAAWTTSLRRASTSPSRYHSISRAPARRLPQPERLRPGQRCGLQRPVR